MIIFKKAEFSDAIQINTLVNSAYRGDSSRAGWTTEADLLGGQRTDPDGIIEMIKAPHSRIELALMGDEILGCVYISEEPNATYFGMLTVNPLFQNKSIGKMLLSRVEELAKESGKTTIRMTVISSRKELIEYYERRGFKWTGKVEPFPENDPRFGIPKTKIFFHEFSKKLVSN